MRLKIENCGKMLSIVIITKNEEHDLARCLESVRWADEIVVVDSGSTDRTMEIAAGFGARFFAENWKGYTAQKNSAVEKAKGDWLLSIDADEALDENAIREVRRVVELNDPQVMGYALRRKVFYQGRWITHGDWYPDYVIRLWRRGKGRFAGRRVHESVAVDGKVQRLCCDILHYTYKDLDDQLQRMTKYARLWAEDQFEKERRPHVWDQWLRPAARFLRAIFIKFGWLDGWRGWLIAWLCSKEVFWKYRQLNEMWRRLDYQKKHRWH
ncbi:MAG: glycosyltransferase family 2 protein [Verrucomicrobiae bacterium]|nr:glycosyltransferase family 2 protein [Verrucomicrobiae bacterium]